MTDHPPHAPEHPTPPPTTPSADQVQHIMRRQNIKLGLGALLLAVMGGFGIYYSATSRAASDDSYNATSVQLANQARNACITERRNDQLDAIRRGIFANAKALKAGLLERDQAKLDDQVALFDQADIDAAAASASLAPEVLDEPPPAGCGAPVLSLDDLPAEDPTSSTTTPDP